jgi:tetratricopeptide (TPR) repeat protein
LSVPAAVMKQVWPRAEVCRWLRVSERQLKSWERQGLLVPAQSFGFSEMIALRTLVGLRDNKISPAKIRAALTALRAHLGDGRNPLHELKIYSHGKKIQVQLAGRRMEPVTGQLLLDFDEEEISRLLAFPAAGEEAPAPVSGHKRKRDAEQWFEKGLDLEQTGAPMEDIIAAYRKAIDIDPASAGALVNLGTVYFNSRNWRDAERYYRAALEIDAEYALAHFNLGNLFDEKGDRAAALAHYESALRSNPSYADAHYNIALLYQAAGQNLKAVRHWKLYLKVDPGSSWANIARRELAKLRDATIVNGTRAD